jgi:hypothetical protein
MNGQKINNMDYNKLSDELKIMLLKRREEMLDRFEKEIYEYLYLETGQADQEDAETEAAQLKLSVSTQLRTAETFLRAKNMANKLEKKI